MFAFLKAALTSRVAGPSATLVCFALAAALVAVSAGASHREARLRAQVVALAARSEQQGDVWRAKLAACQAEAASPHQALKVTRIADPDAEAARLASVGPAGFDVCARMEAADQAVLASLHAK